MLSDFLLSYKDDFQTVILFLTVAASFRWGGRPEQCLGLALLLILEIGDWVNHALFEDMNFARVATGHLVLDLLALIALLSVALYANRMYPLWMTSLQAMVVLSHFTVSLVRTAPLAYSILSITPSYLLIVSLAGGVFAHCRRSRTFKTVRDWRSAGFLQLCQNSKI